MIRFQILVICPIIIFNSCKQPERIIGEDCKKGIAEAEVDFNAGKLGYYPINHIKGTDEGRFKTWEKVLTEQYGLTIKWNSHLDIKQRLCYNESIEKKIEEKFGDDFFAIVNRQVDLLYIMGRGERTRIGYEGGMDSLMNTLYCNLNMLNNSTKDSLPPTVDIRFAIKGTGAADTIEVIRSSEKKYGDEALRVAQLLDKWLPVIENSEIVPTYCTLTLYFKSENKKYCKTRESQSILIE